jgi:cellulose synthase (UDP-forming)
VALVAAAVVGLVRLLTGTATNAVGIGINIAWVAYDLLALSVIYQAALYRAPEPLLEAAT